MKLSDAVQPLPKQTTEFVHGVAESFLDVGRKKAEAPEEGKPRSVPTLHCAYCTRCTAGGAASLFSLMPKPSWDGGWQPPHLTGTL